MRCEQILPYLPGYAGGDLRADTTRIVAEHLGGCASCRMEATRHERVHAGLDALTAREVEAPAYLLDAVLESVHERRGRRVVPVVPPSVPADIFRLVQENKEAIASAAGAVIVAAGAAYAIWRVARSRPAQEPLPSS